MRLQEKFKLITIGSERVKTLLLSCTDSKYGIRSVYACDFRHCLVGEGWMVGWRLYGYTGGRKSGWTTNLCCGCPRTGSRMTRPGYRTACWRTHLSAVSRSWQARWTHRRRFGPSTRRAAAGFAGCHVAL